MRLRSFSTVRAIILAFWPQGVNDYFQNVAISGEHQPASYVLLSGSKISNDHYFLFDELSVSVALSHLNTLDVTKSTGPDGLSARFLKAISNKIAEPLT